MNLPARVSVKSVLESRYGLSANGTPRDRPESWDKRVAGADVILTNDGKTLKLICDGQQSTPKPGWELMLTAGSEQSGYEWTLYGLPAGAQV